MHAGGFCFGRILPYTSRVEGNEVLLQNHFLHFIFCYSSLAYRDCNGEASIAVVGDNEPPLLDYLPDKEVLESLFKSVLDHHPHFIAVASHKKPTRADRKRKKIPKFLLKVAKRQDILFHAKYEIVHHSNYVRLVFLFKWKRGPIIKQLKVA